MKKQDKQALVAALGVHLLFFLGFSMLYWFQAAEEEEPFIFEVVRPPSQPSESPQEEAPMEQNPTERPRPSFDVSELLDTGEEITVPVSQERQRPVVRPEPEPQPEPQPERPIRRSIDDFRREHGEPRPQQPRQPRQTQRTEIERTVIRAPSPRIEDHTLERVSESTSRPHSQTERDELQRYFDRMHAAIYRQWLASSPEFPPGLETRIRFTVSASGRISDVEIIRGSGNSAFDQSVRQAMLALPPLGRVPTNESLRPTLPFRME